MITSCFQRSKIILNTNNNWNYMLNFKVKLKFILLKSFRYKLRTKELNMWIETNIIYNKIYRKLIAWHFCEGQYDLQLTQGLDKYGNQNLIILSLNTLTSLYLTLIMDIGHFKILYIDLTTLIIFVLLLRNYKILIKFYQFPT